MAHLILYIDLEYIQAIVKNEDGKYSFIKTEDRDSTNCFWLFFLIDQYNRRIKYKKSYKLNVHNKKPGYFSYSHPIERDFENETLLFDNHNYKWEELLEISGIIERIKNEFSNIQSEIPAYITYASNISFRNREVLNHYLLKQGINKISDALTFSELYTYKFKDELNINTDIIIIESLNTDLNLSFLHLQDNVYVKPSNAHKLFPNKGNDPRANTLVECVVNELTRQSNFLRIQSNRLSETKQLNNKSNDWLNRLNMTDTLILDDVVLTCDPGVKYRIRITKKEVEDKTGKYIRDLLAEIRLFCTNVKANIENLHYILVGDSFNNNSILSRFTEEFGVGCFTITPSSKIIDILSISEEAYECYKSRIDEVEISKSYNERVELGKAYLAKKEFEKAKTAFVEAKNIRETDEVVLKIGDVEQIILHEKENEKVFKALLKDADKLVEECLYRKAIDKIDEALEIYPDNDFANNQRNLVKLKIDRQIQDFNKLYNEALSLFKQDDFVKSQETLNKALEIIPEDKNALELFEKCKTKQKLSKVLKEAQAEYSKLNFLKAKEIFERGLPDSFCQKMVLQCEQLAILTDDLSKQLMLIHESINTENITPVAELISQTQNVLSEIKTHDETLNFAKYEKELGNYNTNLNALISKTYSLLIKKADELYNKKALNNAIKEYKKALEVVKNDPYCFERIEYIESLLLKFQSNKERSDKLVSEAKVRIDNEDYFSAEKKLKESIDLCPTENEAKDLLDKIAFKIMECRQKFKTIVQKGDKSFEAHDFENAKRFYEEAILIIPMSTQMEDKIKKCNLKLEFKFNEQKSNNKNDSSSNTKPKSNAKKDKQGFDVNGNEKNHPEKKEDRDWDFETDKNKDELSKTNKKKNKNDWDFLDNPNSDNDKFNF